MRDSHLVFACVGEHSDRVGYNKLLIMYVSRAQRLWRAGERAVERWWWSSSDNHTQDNKPGMLEGWKVCWSCKSFGGRVEVHVGERDWEQRRDYGVRLMQDYSLSTIFVVKILRKQSVSNTNYFYLLSYGHVCVRGCPCTCLYDL